MDARQIFERWVKAMNELDLPVLEEILHPDVVVEYPQSGERMRGFEPFRAMLRGYPGGLERDSVEQVGVVEGDERWAISPGYTVVPLTQPDRYTTLVRLAYPDGSWWHAVTFVELKDGKVHRLESYFAPEMPAPLAESIATFGHG